MAATNANNPLYENTTPKSATEIANEVVNKDNTSGGASAYQALMNEYNDYVKEYGTDKAKSMFQQVDQQLGKDKSAGGGTVLQDVSIAWGQSSYAVGLSDFFREDKQGLLSQHDLNEVAHPNYMQASQIDSDMAQSLLENYNNIQGKSSDTSTEGITQADLTTALQKQGKNLTDAQNQLNARNFVASLMGDSNISLLDSVTHNTLDNTYNTSISKQQLQNWLQSANEATDYGRDQVLPTNEFNAANRAAVESILANWDKPQVKAMLDSNGNITPESLAKASGLNDNVGTFQDFENQWSHISNQQYQDLSNFLVQNPAIARQISNSDGTIDKNKVQDVLNQQLDLPQDDIAALNTLYKGFAQIPVDPTTNKPTLDSIVEAAGLASSNGDRGAFQEYADTTGYATLTADQKSDLTAALKDPNFLALFSNNGVITRQSIAQGAGRGGDTPGPQLSEQEQQALAALNNSYNTLANTTSDKSPAIDVNQYLTQSSS